MEGVRQENNFDLIRLAAASLVIISHSFNFCGIKDPIFRFTGSLPGGQFAVYIFFVISGYLVTKSWCKKPDPVLFFEKRILRIYPALFLVLCLSVFIFGPLLTILPLKEYFKSISAYTYFINLSLWKMQLSLPGTLSGTYPTVINAPLWTLFFEFAMYISVFVFGILGIFQKKRLWLIWILFAGMMILQIIGIPKDLFLMKISVNNFSRFFLYFYAGALYYFYAENKKMNGLIVLSLFIAAILSRNAILFDLVSVPAITSAIFFVAFFPKHPLKFITKTGDYSYGLYLYGYIVQNLIFRFIGDDQPVTIHILLSLLLTIPFAIMSWHLLESKAMKLKSNYEKKRIHF